MDMYFIAVLCPPEIDTRVLKWKFWMKEQYGCEAALRSPAHITLVPPFWMKPEMEDDLRNSLFTFSATQQSFSIQLNNFSGFKPRVLFVEVLPNPQLSHLQSGLTDYLLSENRYPLKRDDRPFHPHVTIATRDLHKKAFDEAWNHFREKTYAAAWTTNGLSLLRHNKKNWDVIATSQFH